MEAENDLAYRVEALRGASIFGTLDEPFLRRLAGDMTEVDLPAGHVLIEPRATGSGLFVVVEGTVSVEPRGVAARELGPGSVVGELALLTRDGTRTARVRATTPVRCLALDRASFDRALEDEPSLAVALVHAAAERLELPS